MVIETKKVLVSLDGKPIKFDEKELTLGLALANILLSQKEKHYDPLKMYSLSLRLYQATGNVDVDKADFATIKEVVTQCNTFTTIVTGQILDMLSSVDADAKEEKGIKE